MGTHWEQGEKTKYNPLPFPFPSLFKRKKLDTFMSACSEIVGHSVSIGHLKGHVPMAEEKWLVQRTWIQAINNSLFTSMYIMRDLPQQKNPRAYLLLGELPQFYMFPRSNRNISFYKMKRNKEIKREFVSLSVGRFSLFENRRFFRPVLRTASALFLFV
jgi:hypothetical protein